jgi:hypothetical protein
MPTLADAVRSCQVSAFRFRGLRFWSSSRDEVRIKRQSRFELRNLCRFVRGIPSAGSWTRNSPPWIAMWESQLRPVHEAAPGSDPALSHRSPSASSPRALAEVDARVVLRSLSERGVWPCARRAHPTLASRADRSLCSAIGRPGPSARLRPRTPARRRGSR